MTVNQPYESPALWAITGPAIRPGGIGLTRRAARFCCLKAGDRVLDVGCGAGASVDFLKSEFQAKAIGVDQAPLLLAEARRRDPGLPVIRGNAFALPVKAERCTAVFYECVLSLLTDPGRALNECYRVLRPGGFVIVTDIYQRAKTLGSDLTANARGSLEGSVSRDILEQRAAAAGFALCLWEDHSHLLKELAARLVWAGISLAEFWGVDCFRAAGLKQQRSGYFLLVAKKGGQPHG